MKGTLLRLYTHELQVHEARPLHVWLLEHARGMGISAGAAFRTTAGSAPGLHLAPDDHTNEETGPLVVVEFAIADDDAVRLLESLAAEPVHLPFSRQPMEWQRTGAA